MLIAGDVDDYIVELTELVSAHAAKSSLVFDNSKAKAKVRFVCCVALFRFVSFCFVLFRFVSFRFVSFCFGLCVWAGTDCQRNNRI